MKKVSIIILLTVLLLSAFTACNGDVFSELMPKDDPEPTPKRVITLEIPSTWEYFSFDESDASVKTKTLEIPEDCDTWAEYLEEVTDIKVYRVAPLVPYEYTLAVKADKVYFGDFQFGLILKDSKGVPPIDTVDASATIEIGGTYTLTQTN